MPRPLVGSGGLLWPETCPSACFSRAVFAAASAGGGVCSLGVSVAAAGGGEGCGEGARQAAVGIIGAAAAAATTERRPAWRSARCSHTEGFVNLLRTSTVSVASLDADHQCICTRMPYNCVGSHAAD
jgi:hypothetical protein